RAVQGREYVAAILGGKVLAVVEREAKRSRMRLQQHVGDRDLVLQVGARSDVPGILVGTDVEPWPAIERILADAGHIIAHRVVTEAVAFIGRAPGHVGLRLDRKPDAIADAGGKDALVLAVGIEGKHRRAVGLVAPGGAERTLALPAFQATRRGTHALP